MSRLFLANLLDTRGGSRQYVQAMNTATQPTSTTSRYTCSAADYNTYVSAAVVAQTEGRAVVDLQGVDNKTAMTERFRFAGFATVVHGNVLTITR